MTSRAVRYRAAGCASLGILTATVLVASLLDAELPPMLPITSFALSYGIAGGLLVGWVHLTVRIWRQLGLADGTGSQEIQAPGLE